LSIASSWDRAAGIIKVPPDFCDELFDLLTPLSKGTGLVTDKFLERALGKAGRLSYLIPAVRPFVAALWGAWSGSRDAHTEKRREAPPGQHAAKRFSSSARWLQFLLRPTPSDSELLPLEQVVVAELPAISGKEATIHVDASPWGGGAVLFEDGVATEVFIMTWTSLDEKQLKVKIGDPAGQTAFEYYAILLTLIIFATRFRDTGLAILSDNIAAVNGAITLKGKNNLTIVTRELAWRKVRYGWRFAAAHLPAEMNTLADALSRLSAPSGSDRKCFPQALATCVKQPAPDPEDVWRCK